MKIVHVVGARPNFPKVAPLLAAWPGYVVTKVCHTGQHYSPEMQIIPLPIDTNLGETTLEGIIPAFREYCRREAPDLVVVVGDVTSTLACALAARSLNIPIAHVEAGLRSGVMTMPEEVNRRLVDHISDFRFCSEVSGIANLAGEGLDGLLVGNIMIDSLVRRKRKARWQPPYALLTVHRPRNTNRIHYVLDLVNRHSPFPVLWPVHHRAKDPGGFPNIQRIPAQGYDAFLGLLEGAALVITDSGGVQEEACYLGTRCFTLRKETERPSTVDAGANVLWTDSFLVNLDEALALPRPWTVPPLWDGNTAQRIVKEIL